MSTYNQLFSKEINIPTPDEIRAKKDVYTKNQQETVVARQSAFIQKANDAHLAEKIVAIISKEMINTIYESYFLDISWSINLNDAEKFINLVVKPMFETQGWVVSVCAHKKLEAKCCARWEPKWFSFSQNFTIIDQSSHYCLGYNVIEIKFAFPQGLCPQTPN